MYKEDLALNNLQWLIYHKTQPNQIMYIWYMYKEGLVGARGVMVIVAGIGHGDTSSNPGLIAFHIALIPLGKVWIWLFSLQLWVNSRADLVLQPWWGN